VCIHTYIYIYTSLGIDLSELYAPRTSEARYTEFWRISNTFLSRLYSSPLVTIAAIRGACPAGGCMLSLCCDYRIMNIEGNPTIGLNEVALGIPVPKYWIEVMTRLIGFGQTEQLLSKAIMPTSKEAEKIGLIHRTVPKSDLLGTAEIEMQLRLKFSDDGRIVTKQSMRKELSDRWIGAAAEETAAAWKRLSSPTIVKQLEAVLARLSQNKQKAKL
jgi:3,2-trans-enoyl-CoA isomerase